MSELNEYAASKDYAVIEVCQETISGQANDEEREGLQRVEELAAAGKIRKVLVHDISRIAWRNSVAHKFVETLEHHGVSLYWHAQGIEPSWRTGSAIRQSASCSRSSRRWPAANTSC